MARRGIGALGFLLACHGQHIRGKHRQSIRRLSSHRGEAANVEMSYGMFDVRQDGARSTCVFRRLSRRSGEGP